MQIQINTSGLKSTDAIDAHIENELANSLTKYQDRITRVEVHLHDENAHKHGVDKRCVMEARPAGHQPVTVSHDSEDMYEAIRRASGKLERALSHVFGKLDARER